MRLDLVLKQTRIIKRRTIAKEVCDMGKVSINGKVAKPSSEVNDGDILDIKMGPKSVRAKITYTKQGNKDIPTFEELKDNNA